MRLYQELLKRAAPSQPAAESRLSIQDVAGLFNSPDHAILPSTWGNIGNEELVTSVAEAYRKNGPVFALVLARMQVFSQARFMWTKGSYGNPRDFFDTAELRILETPWPGGRTGDLLSRMEVDVSTAGNAFVRRIRRGDRRKGTFEDRLAVLRPEWCTILIGSQEDAEHPSQASDAEFVGVMYKPGGGSDNIQFFDRAEVAHYAPIPDPVEHYRGMSWITPVIQSVQADHLTEVHKTKFFQNAATPNMGIKFDPSVPYENVLRFKALIEDGHKGAWNAYKTLYLGGGADPVPMGNDFKQMEFAITQGRGESRLANASGVPQSWVGFAEGMQGSSLNEGNFAAARRRFGDGTMHHLWSEAAASLQAILDPPPAGVRLWHDTRWVPFLREDAKDHAATQQQEAATMRTLIEAGYEPESVAKAITESNWDLLKHSGLVSVQLQKPGTPGASPTEGEAGNV